MLVAWLRGRESFHSPGDQRTLEVVSSLCAWNWRGLVRTLRRGLALVCDVTAWSGVRGQPSQADGRLTPVLPPAHPVATSRSLTDPP